VISIGVDIGRKNDPAAVAVLQTDDLRPGSHRPLWRGLDLGNIKIGTTYTMLGDIIAGLGLEFATAGYPVVVTVDATGVGAPVLERARDRAPDLHIIGVTISAGRALSQNGPDDYTVGKHRLTEVLQVALQQRGLVLADTPGAKLFGEQLRAFVAKPTASGYHRHEAAGDGHDDVLLAAELALWAGDTMFDQMAGVAL
jgi:hypothetical protein